MAISCGERNSTSGTTAQTGDPPQHVLPERPHQRHTRVLETRHVAGRHQPLDQLLAPSDPLRRHIGGGPAALALHEPLEGLGRARHVAAEPKHTVLHRLVQVAELMCLEKSAGIVRHALSMVNGPNDMPNSERTWVARLEPLRCMQRMGTSVLPSHIILRACPLDASEKLLDFRKCVKLMLSQPKVAGTLRVPAAFLAIHERLRVIEKVLRYWRKVGIGMRRWRLNDFSAWRHWNDAQAKTAKSWSKTARR